MPGPPENVLVPRISRLAFCTALALAATWSAATVRGELIEGFEGLDPNWKQLGADGPTRVDRHERVLGAAHSGQGCEHFELTCGAGTYVYLGQTIPPARFIDELTPSLWVRSDRTGLQLLARVVFPRSLDRRGQPRSLLLAGTAYERAGTWQQLTIADGAQQLPARLRVLRSQIAADVDPREAYIDLVALNAYAGPGVTQVWIDDLEIAGYVAGQAAASRPVPSPGTRPASPSARGGEIRPAAFDAPPGARAAAARLVGSILMVEGRPFFPRIVEHRGEPFEVLRDRGFNAVRLASHPTDPQLDEAQRTGMWLVASPPPLVPGQPIGPRFERVLSWDLGRKLDPTQMEAVRQHADLVRLADRAAARPLVAHAESGLAGYSRSADILLALREPLLSSQLLPEYAAWLRSRPRLARPGTPWWMPVQNEPAESLVRQVGLLAAQGSAPPSLELEQLRLVALSAVACGARGLYFPSRTPLQGEEPAVRLRQTQLELLGLELASIEPWAAAGSFVTEIAASPEVRVAVLALDRSQLWIVLRQTPQATLSLDAAAAQPLSFVVPGVNDAATAYEITAGGLKQLRHRRVAGGVRVTLDDFSHATLVAFTDDPLVVGNLTRRLASTQARAAKLRSELAAIVVGETEAVERRLAQLGKSPPQAQSSLAEARGWLGRSEALLSAGELGGAQQFALAAERAAARIRRAAWLDATRGLAEPSASPLCLNFATLPAHLELSQALAERPPGANVLLGGVCEDLPYMVQAGWRHYRSEVEGVASAVELSPEQPYQGRFSLHLKTAPRDPRTAPLALEGPAVWVVSAPVTLPARQIVRISGWVRMPEAMAASNDGLMIFDSSGGPDLALRVRQAGRWQPFVLYRAVEANQPLAVSLVLTGMGEAWVDDLTISPLR